MKFGWKKSSGTLNVDEFKSSNTIVKLASVNSGDHIIPEYTPISNQKSLSSCVANAVADSFEILYGLEHPNSVKQLSRLFLYWNARLYTQDTDKDEGTFIHNAMDSLKNLGVCLESTWPYDESKVFAQPTQIAYKEGDDNTFNNYYQITSSGQQRLNDIELAIRANHPVVFGALIGKELVNYDGNPNTVFEEPKNSIGGHAMIITGVKIVNGERQFYIRNSWGYNWGITGHAWFSGNYIMSNVTSDIFVGTRFPGLLV